jgi:Tol biopolymer transport system component
MRKLIFVVAAGVLAVTALVAPALATFEGSNGRLLYQGIVGEHEQLFTVKPDGSDVRQLTDFSDSDAINGSWSPDSKKIAFLRRWGHSKWRVYTMNADGSGKREFHRTLRGTPAWLPDGKHLFLLKKLTWTIVDASGGAPRDAGIPGTHGDSPCLLPDGERVAMTATLGRKDGKVAIVVARIGGGPQGIQRITPWQSLGGKIDCSPDGSKILFSAPQFGPTSPDSTPSVSSRSSNVYVINVDGTGLRQLTHSTGGKVNNGANSWSPDGRKISFISNRGGAYGVYTMNADGTGVRKLTKNPGDHLSAWGSHP